MSTSIKTSSKKNVLNCPIWGRNEISPKSVFRADGDFKWLPTIFIIPYSKAAEKP